MKRLFLLAALLLLPGCPLLGTEDGGEVSPQAVEDFSYDLFVKEVSSVPDYPRLTEEYIMRAQIQIYGRYLPSAYSIWVLDGNSTIFNETINSPQALSHYDFPFYGDSPSPRHIRVEVESLDDEHPEPEENLGNNVLRKDARAYPLGYYDLHNWEISWFYDAVGMQVKQAQAFTLEKPLNISEISVYVQARVPCPPASRLIVSLHEHPESWGNIGVGGKILTGEIDASAIGGSPSWQSIRFNRTSLQNGTYWIVLEFESPSSAGIEWYRAEGNPFGGVYDTQMLDISGYGE
jgi:hypothetical protein